jgi:crossover junction endodeoxyribonuclease RuvC
VKRPSRRFVLAALLPRSEGPPSAPVGRTSAAPRAARANAALAAGQGSAAREEPRTGAAARVALGNSAPAQDCASVTQGEGRARTARRVLGIDPGSVRTGWGVVEQHGHGARGIAAGVIRVPERAPLAERLEAVHRGLVEVLAAHRPDAVAIEDIFFARYAQAALMLGHARGVALLAAAQAGLLVSAYPPAVVKRAIVGSGRAEKQQVAQLIGALLGLRELPSLDATDALAVALTHLNVSRLGV